MTATPLSYSYDLTRDEIIARYRNRISLDKRSKLGKSEGEQLILHLIDCLKTFDDRSSIKALCDAEIALLEESYQTNTIAFDYLPKYRGAVEKAITDGIIPITPNNSHRYIHTQRVTGVEEERFEHYALTYLKYDAATYDRLDTRSSQTNRHKQLNLKGVNPHLYLDKLNQLLYSNDKFAARHQAIAMAGLTGRRLNEVLARGKFSLGEHPYLLRFEGHSKVERDAYDIVTLIEAAQLLPVIEQFRSQDEIQPLLTLRGDELTTAINKFDVQVNRECNKYLGDIVPPHEGREAVSVHNLRGLWGAIAAYFFCPPSSHEYPFLQHYLGHAINSAATGHYFRYRLIDDDGHYLEDRGIKIAQFGELPIPNSRGAKAKIVDEAASTAFIITDTATETFSENLTLCVPSVSPTPTTETLAEILVEAVPSVSRKPTTDAPLKESHPPLSFLPSGATHPKAQSLQSSLIELFNSDRYTHLLTGLMAVTGLKAGELLKSQKFYPHPDEAFAVLFSSTVTTSFDRLVTLVDGAAVLDAISQLKNHPDVQPLFYLSPNEIDSRCLPHVTQILSSLLPFQDLDEMMTTRETLISTSEPQPQPEKQKRPSTTIYNLYTNDRHRLDTITSSLGWEGTQATVFHSLLDWVEEELKKPTIPVTVPLDESLTIADQAKTLAWLTGEITSLRERVTTLEQERDELKSQLEKASIPDPQIDRLKSENDRLSSELDKAHSTLSVFRQLLNGGDEKTDELPGVKSKPPHQKVRGNSKTATVPQPVQSFPNVIPEPTLNKRTTSKNRRRSRSDGGARARAISIWNALQQWNQLHPDNTFALTPALLEVTFHIHRQAAKDFINEYRMQIEQHHQAIAVTTLRTHNRGKDVEPFKAFVGQY